VNKKCDVDLVVLQYDLSMHVVLHIKPMSDSLLYTKYVVVFFVLSLIDV
jgi:hypothetical protein